jgi:DNA oxidative demethylase
MATMTTGKPLDSEFSTRVLPGFRYLRAHLPRSGQQALMEAIKGVTDEAPFYRPTMPRTGKAFSVRMTNCGPLGWVSDANGYRYQPTHPKTGRPWPKIPEQLLKLWLEVAGDTPPPEACLVNHYATGTRLGSHVDADEEDRSAPVISVSLGDNAQFHVGGLRRTDPKHRLLLTSGDVVVLGGDARMAYHGIDKVIAGTSDLVPWGGRINLTMRRVRISPQPC